MPQVTLTVPQWWLSMAEPVVKLGSIISHSSYGGRLWAAVEGVNGETKDQLGVGLDLEAG